MAPTDPSELARAQEACAREPVHIPGAVQPSGCLISLDQRLRRLLQASANLHRFFGVTPEQALASDPKALLGRHLLRRISASLPQAPLQPVSLVAGMRLRGRNRRFRTTAYRSGERVVLEFEALSGPDTQTLFPAMGDWLSHLAGARTAGALLETLVAAARDLTGHERAMVYQFDPDWHGCVVAESRCEHMDSYLSHHFPASDIPPQVRRLYDVNPVRSIPDAPAAPVPLVPTEDPLDQHPLDLSAGVLRAVSPIHQAYLHNMGVKSALSVAIRDDAEGLWGLLACHGQEARSLPPTLRDAVLALVQVAQSRLMLLNAQRNARYQRRVRACRARLVLERRPRATRLSELVADHGADWLTLFRACGIALAYRGQYHTFGTAPPDRTLAALVQGLVRLAPRDASWSWHSPDDWPVAAELPRGRCCGLLAAPVLVDSEQPAFLLFFRAENVQTRLWAGRPEALWGAEKVAAPLTPRHSFAAWREEVRGHSAPWRDIEREAVLDLADEVAVLLSRKEIDLLNAQLTEANRRLKRQATTDSLTGVWNRYRMQEQIELERGAHERYGTPCSLLLFDIDHFKAVNDQYGHEAGDQVLVALARAVVGELRATDFLGRWGGEEFIVLATNSAPEEAWTLAERLRQCIAGLRFPGVGPVTISVGVASLSRGDTVDRLIDRADRAMYRAKQRGRNRVEQAE
ncbi:diguanylate cyclase [Alkalilimnicola ehrlichii]|uniref:sensor domain-containing diguanylate cyclase n=1 Tax=Alkalilimnicola ehrlichii TaxID=351052 RepID=UPI003BA2FB9A